MACDIAGDPDLYGLGIRIGFYLLWFALITANWIATSEVPVLRLATVLYIGAIFISLIIQASNSSLHPSEAYVMILLTYGTFYYLLPMYLWRAVTGCSPFWNPSQWPFVKSTRIYQLSYFLLLLAVTSFQIWFWCSGITSLPSAGCQESGFFFAQVPLSSGVFIAVNLLFVFILLVCGLVNFLLAAGVIRPPRWVRKALKKANKHGITKDRRFTLQQLQTFSEIAVASVLVAAVELTVQWNNITGVSDVTTTAQTIPLVVAAGLFAHVFYVFYFGSDDDLVSSDGSSEGSGSTTSEVEVVIERG